MFDYIIAYSVKNKFVIGLLVAALIAWGIASLRQLPIDAVPDITNNQVQILTVTPTLATQEVEQFVTTPIELALQSLQRTEEIRSISRFGLSVITVVFEEDYDIYLARQLVSERLQEAQDAIPEGLGTPEMAPLSTGLGEIYQYVVRPTEGYEDQYTATDLRSIQDWIVKRQLLGIEGVAEVNSLGGFVMQYEVSIDPDLLKALNISIIEVFDALKNSNENTGGAYIEKNSQSYYIRSEGLAKTYDDIGRIVIKNNGNLPIRIRDVATIQDGKAPRYGALVRNGQEVVGGKVMMFKGANSAQVTERVKDRVEQVQKSLPEGVVIEPYLVRDKLVKTAIGTVKTNLIEGGLIVIFILVLLLGNWRAGLIVASVIPLAMLFAISMMNVLGISANLMSLGAIDFGLIVDGAVIIVEAIVHRLQLRAGGKTLTAAEMDDEVITSAQKIRQSAAFGEIIILMVYIPILALVGIEGKMFKPMAQTVMLAISGALILSLTYVPMMSALVLKKTIVNKTTTADRIIAFFQRCYAPILNIAMRYKLIFLGGTLALFLYSIFVFSKLGGEFIPTLEEGDLALQHILPPGSSLSQSIANASMIQKKLMDDIPEIQDIVVNIGAAEIPTDPMPVEIGDYVLVMQPKKQWTTAKTRQGMFEKIGTSLDVIPGVDLEFSQPIQLRFNELMTGTKADIAIKLFGEDLNLLYQYATQAESIINKIDGVGTVNVEQTIGMPQLMIDYDEDLMSQYGLHVQEVNQMVRMAFAGEKAGLIYEGEKRYDLVVRLDEAYRQDLHNVEQLYINLNNGHQVPLTSIADIRLINAPMQVSRENTNRRIVIGVNVGKSDIETLVENIKSELDAKLALPPGYYLTYGGQFENLKAANARLAIAVPIALALIFILLYFTFHSVPQAILIFTAIPLSAIGGIWSLVWRGLPFSISAGIGFIALFGVAVLNGIVLIGYFNQLKKEGMTDILERIRTGTRVRLRPVLLTASVASLGFLPMALSTSGGAEVQRPLATVVIGGLITATFLTLVIIPILYYYLERWGTSRVKHLGTSGKLLIGVFFLSIGGSLGAQPHPITLDSAIQIALTNHPNIQIARHSLSQAEAMTGMKYNLGTTEISFAGDGLWDQSYGQQVNQIGIVQNIPHPKSTTALNQLQDERVAKSRTNQQLSEYQLSWQIRQLYNELQYAIQLESYHAQMAETYLSYLRQAEKKVEFGAANPIEEITLRTKWQEQMMLRQQSSITSEMLHGQLLLQLGITEEVTPAETLSPFINLTSTEESDNLFLRQMEQEIAIQNAQIEVMNTELKPSFQVGYAAQRFVEGGWLNALQAGVTIPLFNSQSKQRIEAQKIAVSVATANYESQRLSLSRDRLTAQQSMRMYREGITYYEHQINLIQPEITRISKLNYEAGEISYLELLNTLQIMAQQNKSYWDQVRSYNRAAYDYLLSINQ